MSDPIYNGESAVMCEPATTAVNRRHARAWYVLFLLLWLCVYGVRTGCLAFVASDQYMAMVPLAGGLRERIDDPRLEAVFQDPSLLDLPEYADVNALLSLLSQPEYTAVFDRLSSVNQPEYTERMEGILKEVSIFLYVAQILGAAGIPALLSAAGVLRSCRKEKRITVFLLAFSVAILPVFLFARGLLWHPVLLHTLIYLFALCTAAAMGIALRRGALCWGEGKAALAVGSAVLLDHVFGQLSYYSWMATENPVIYLGYTYVFFAGLLIAAAALRLRLGAEDTPALPSVSHAYPRRFAGRVLALISVHCVFSSAINTVIYFENMDDFHTPGYELFFYALAFFIMLAAVLLYDRRRWLAPVLTGLLLVCFGQGLSLFGIRSTELAVAYNLITMAGKMPVLLAAMIVPVYYAAGSRKPGLACLGFIIPCGADFLMNLTRFTPGGIEGALPGESRQGVLLLVGLILIGAVFCLYAQFIKTRTDALIKGIREGVRERRSVQDTVDSLDLTAREKEVTALLLAGDSQKMIASKLKISFSTVSFHMRNLYRKLDIQSRGELFALFLQEEVA